MTFREQYLALEKKFREQVEDDRKFGIESSFLSNIDPRDHVDFVLVAMEPSTGVSGKKPLGRLDGKPRKDKNFCWSTEDFVFHFAIRNYLCRGGKTYHLTDLSKGAMKVREAKKKRQEKYERWYPLLKEELRLVSNSEKTRIIAIGNVVRDFLKSKSLCDSIEKVIHYSPQGWMARRKAIQCYIDDFTQFNGTLNGDAFEETVRDVLNQAGMDSEYVDFMLEKNVNKSKLTESRRKSLFYYYNIFEELRCADHITLKHPDEWK